MDTTQLEQFITQDESPRLILFVEHPFQWSEQCDNTLTFGDFLFIRQSLTDTPLLIIVAQKTFSPTSVQLQQMCTILNLLPCQIPLIYIGLGNGLAKKIKHGSWTAVCDHIVLHSYSTLYDQFSQTTQITTSSSEIYRQELLSELCNAGFLCGFDLPMCTAFHYPNWQQTTPSEIKFTQQSQAELITSRLPLLALIAQHLHLPIAGLLCIANSADPNGFFSKTQYNDDDYRFFMQQARHLLKTYLKLLSPTEQSDDLLHLLTANKPRNL